MPDLNNTGGQQNNAPVSRPQGNVELLEVRGVAALLHCSPRHVYRLADSGRMPRPLRLGALVRWNRAVLMDWIAGGCKSVRIHPRAGQ